MDLKRKIKQALSEKLRDAAVRLEENGGVSGYVVSPRFKGMSSLDRQCLIDEALDHARTALTPEERHRILMIAALTPVEFSTVGSRIRVHKIKPTADGAFEIVLHGEYSDAEYVRGALNNQKGVTTTDPKPVAGASGILTYFLAKGTKSDPLTKHRMIRILKSDPYIEVMPHT